MSGCCLTPRGKLGSICDDDTMYVVTTCLLREYTTNALDGMEIQVIHLKSFEVHVEFKSFEVQVEVFIYLYLQSIYIMLIVFLL